MTSQADAGVAGSGNTANGPDPSEQGPTGGTSPGAPSFGTFVGIAIGGLAVVAAAAAVVVVVLRRRRSPTHGLAPLRSPLSDDSEAPPPKLVVASDDVEQLFDGHSAA